MEYPDVKTGTPVYASLQLAEADNNALYPALLSLRCDSFKASYALLLVKKNSRELAISKNKFATSEAPFSLADLPFFFNGILDNSRDAKGTPVFTLERIQRKHRHHLRTDTLHNNKNTAEKLLAFFRDAPVKFTKTSNIPWTGNYSDRIVVPSQSPAYFGLLDTIFIPTKDGTIDLSGPNKNDVVSVSLNGRVFLDQVALGRRGYHDEILLDTGLNVLILFAENFPDEMPNRGTTALNFGNKKFKLDFGRKDDSAASFIAARIYYEQDKSKDIYFEEYEPEDKALGANQKMIGSVKSVSKQITLAIWDDAVEDGDSISVNINGTWIAKGFPVKKNPQFITVTLKPGPNTITFIGDNLGSIPPNTSVLEIIDGKKRKSFLLETVPGEDNLLKIFYDN